MLIYISNQQLELPFLIKDISNDAKFAVDDNGLCVKPKNLNESNYKNYFHTTDLDQGCLGNWYVFTHILVF